MLALAPILKRGPQRLDPADVSLEQNIGWIREAAGERFDRLELSHSAFGIALIDSPSGASIASFPPDIHSLFPHAARRKLKSVE